MDLYRDVSYGVSKLVTERYSTSFSTSTRLFEAAMRPHIYAIYGLVRIADEIVDTYRGDDAGVLLDELEAATYRAIDRGYDTNPVIHAFALTAKEYGIGSDLIRPFFQSMAMDLQPATYTDELYATYIYGSAEVVGLMCLRIFCGGDQQQYTQLEPGARSLGAAYQKVNFLRDISEDYKDLGRLYFPGKDYDAFDENDKDEIITDIQNDITHARLYVDKLPPGCRLAVRLSVEYYGELLENIRSTPVEILKQRRVRVPTTRKLWLYIKVRVGAAK